MQVPDQHGTSKATSMTTVSGFIKATIFAAEISQSRAIINSKADNLTDQDIMISGGVNGVEGVIKPAQRTIEHRRAVI